MRRAEEWPRDPRPNTKGLPMSPWEKQLEELVEGLIARETELTRQIAELTTKRDTIQAVRVQVETQAQQLRSEIIGALRNAKGES